MKFTIKLWILEITIDLFDLDPSDRNIKFSITIAW